MKPEGRHHAFFIALLVTVFIGAASIAVQPGDAFAQDSDNTHKSGSHKKHSHIGKGKHKTHHAHLVYLRPQPASFIMDAATGQVLESENADSLRYPASLTKMMTLYLTFDALKKGKFHLDQTIPVSTHAASQPQTNISLQPGEHIAVKDAILSIVVRSANDSAVTLGEALGNGSEADFARKMTEKARALGMKHTVFYNASGLPDPAQHTTARDMALLGRALRRDFPQYFAFFRVESFSYHGTMYVTHNHVMTRYAGVDGIKTGYIRTSGFNLVTSANHGGHTLIAVVLGGPTSRARDDKMIGLLDHTFTEIAAKDGTKTMMMAKAETPAQLPAGVYGNDESAEGEGDLPGDAVKEMIPPKTAGLPQQANASANEAWGIQVGVFTRKDEAVAAAAHAVRLAPQELASAGLAISTDNATTAPHRARLVSLSQEAAEGACRKLAQSHQPCFAYRAN